MADAVADPLEFPLQLADSIRENRPVPQHAADAFRATVDRWLNREFASLDAALDLQRPSVSPLVSFLPFDTRRRLWPSQ
jgi:hypothetical protein